MISSRLVAFTAIVSFAASLQLQENSEQSTRANPIRKVVKMLEMMQKKVEAEGEKEKEMFDKYMCYCKTSGGDLQASIATSESKAPQVSSDIKEGEAKKAGLDEDLVNHKKDREAAKATIAEVTAIREKEAAAFAEKKASYGSDIAAMEKAIAALEKGMAGAFLQTSGAQKLRSIVQSNEHMLEADREEILAFIEGGQGSQYAPQSGEITGILKELMESMAKGLSEETATEEAAIASYEALVAAKNKEIGALTASIEEKTVQTGELAVSIVNMKDDLSDTEAALLEDKQFLADLSKNCETKQAEWDVIVKTRSEELSALAETIKVLNDDEALELFKKTLPSAASSFVQVKVAGVSMTKRALAVIRAAQGSTKKPSHQLDLIALALHGKNVEMGKVIAMIDEMVAVLKKEQTDDDSKKEFCTSELDTSDDKKKGLELALSEAETAISSAEGSIATITSEIEALVAGIKELDKAVAEATDLRKDQHADYVELIAQDSAAKELLEFAKNNLNKFYNPKLYVPPPKQELSAEDTIVVNLGGTAPPTPAPGGIAGTGVAVLGQSKAAPPPPPETFGAYSKKTEETTGVISMIDMLIKDLDKEMTTAETEEKDGQADYEAMMKDSAAKRAADSKLLSEKEGSKAETEAALQAASENKAVTSKELMGALETIKALHTECDWLLQYHDVRKEARAGEIESLNKAKAVLSGSDFS